MCFLLQGQEVVAENALDVASKEGQWVVLQVGSFIQLEICITLCKRIPSLGFTI